jgi:tRNA (guanine-N7-)-methyltransferase
MRHRKIHGVDQRLRSMEEYLIRPQINEILNPKLAFDNENEIFEMEIGIGKGKFITTMASLYPERNFIGIELRDQIILRAVEKASSMNLKNVRFLTGNALELSEYFVKDSFDKIYLNFSDPWPKERHSKRRLTSKIFLESYKRILKPIGKIQFKTDNLELFEFTLNEIAMLDLKFDNIKLDLHADENIKDNITTEYEERFLGLGKKIMRVVFSFREENNEK